MKPLSPVTAPTITASSTTTFPVTIIINNYNYGRFLRCAIESALAQTYPETEVIVVDDGSTDDSLAILASYGKRIDSVLKENGGQASALNAGFARSQGVVVIFLDADDMLHPDVVERVAEHFQADPNVVRVQYRLEVIDTTGVPTGLLKPPRHQAIPSGDLTRQVLLYGDDIPWLPTSGNAFSASMLQRIFPIPERTYRICADYYLSNLSPLFGLVDSLHETGGYYRIHGANNHQKEQLALQQTHQLIIRTHLTHGYIHENAQRLGLAKHSAYRVARLSLTFVANRLISLRLDPAHHPIDGDARFALARRGMLAAVQRADLPLLLRLIYIAWFLLVSVVPKGIVRWLAEQFFFPEHRGQWFNGLLSNLHRVSPLHKVHNRAMP
jgi:glycosyltransferase involved in cell wall biosynthesis